MKCTVFRAEPVNIITGEVWLEQSDFTLAGRIPIEWIRSYTSNNHRRGASGVGWETPADGRLEFDPSDASVVFRYPGEGPALFLEKPSAEGDEAAVMELMNGALLSDHGDEWRVRTKRDLIYHFPKVRSQTTPEGLVELPLGQVSDPWGNWLKFLYEAGRLVAILESAGRYLSFEYTDLGFIKAIALRVPGSEQEYPYLSCEYNLDGDLTVVRDPLGNPYLFEYDEHHMTRHVDRNDLSFFYAYDKTGDEWKAIRTWGDGGLYDYRFDYLAELRETRITDSLGQVSTVKCHESGLPVMEIDPLGGRTLFEYDEAGRTTAVVDPANHRTEYRYDERGNQIAEILPDGSTLAVEMDENSKPVAITEPNGAVWRNVWNERGLLESRTSPLGAVTRYRYDPSGLPTTLIDAQEQTTQLEFDRFGALVGLTNALQATTRLKRDEQGNLLALTDALGRTTRYRYDAKNRLIEVRPTEGGQIRFSYDGEDNLVAHEDKNGNQTGFEYFGQALLTKVHQPNGHSIEYHYDTEERLVGITNQRGERYTIRHDALGRVVEEVDYWGQSTHYRLDLAGYLKQRIDPLGQVTDYACDKLGRILRKSMDHPNRVGARFEERFKYDINGNLTECSNEHGKIQRKFDQEGRLSEEKQGAFLIKYEYDSLGRCIRRDTGHHAIGYQYDPLGRPVSIQIDDEPPITFERDASGQRLKEQLSPALERYSGYDEAGRLIAQGVKGEADWLFKTTYDYDRVGNLVRREDSQFGVDQYRYDPVGQIIEHIDPQGRLNAFLQDPAGDRLRTQVVDMPVRQVVGGADMPGEWYREGVYEGAYYRFDRAGNLTTKRDLSAGSAVGGQSRETRLSWDANQRLVRSEANGVETSYGYDPLGRRLFKQTGTRRTWFGWEGNALAAEWTVEMPEQRAKVAVLSPIAKAGLREYLYYPNSFEPLALIEDEASYRYHTEPNGTPTRVMHTDGTLVWAATYGVWGQVEPAVNTLDNRLRMQGQYHDEETGLYYNRYRYYDANVGQFVGQDPIGLLGGLNSYQYAPNGFGWADPLGLEHAPGSLPGGREKFVNALKEITDFRANRGLPVFDPNDGKTGTVAYVDLGDSRTSFGVNSKLEPLTNPDLRRQALTDIQENLGKLQGRKISQARFLTHAEAQALIKAKDKFGTLPNEVTIYVDRVTCNFCNSDQKGLGLLRELFGIETLHVVDSNGNVISFPKD
ncbi:MAG: RHS repeat-associated core domain-containing protein [Candidatus Thiodiazotropha sp.]